MTKPIAAVVIPVYNKAGTVARTIKSVIDQTVTNIEIVVVDDGSTDSSKQEALKAFVVDGEKDERCKYVWQPNSGVAVARNNGVLDHTAAPFVMCLDSDDAIEPEYLERLLPTIMKSRGTGIVYTGLRYILPNGTEGISPWPGEFDAEKHLYKFNQIPTAALTRREVWERLGGQRQRFAPGGAGAEDGDFWLRAVSFGFDAEYVPPKDGAYFVYSWQSGLVSGDKNYREPDYRAWSPWTRDVSLTPTSCVTKPSGFSHPARQYDEPLVSVIIPVGPGHPDKLANSLDSLVAQTFMRWEAIVVFDVGKDEWKHLSDTGVLDYIARTWPFCHFTSTHSGGVTARQITDSLDVASGASLLAGLPAGKPRGAGAARNAGLRLARGRLVSFLDADDWFVPTALKEMIEAYANTGKIVFSDHLGIANIPQEKLSYVDGTVVAYNYKNGEAFIEQKISDYDCERALEQPYTDGRVPYVVCNISVVMPTKWAREVGFREDLSSWEDVLFFWELSWRGRCFTRIPKPLLVYRYSTGTRRDAGLRNIPELISKLKEASDGANKMGCGCRGGAPPSGPSATATVGGTVMADQVTVTLSRGGQINVFDSDFVLAEYNPPTKGDQMRYGLHDFGGGYIKYGYLSGGENILVHKMDIEADKAMAMAQGRQPLFVPIQDDRMAQVEAEEEEIQELPEPEMIEEPEPEAPEALWLEEEEDARLPDQESYFPEKVESNPLVMPLVELEYEGVRNPDRYIALFKSHGIETALDLIKYEQDNQLTDGLAGIKGVGPKVREVFLDAAKRATGLEPG